MGYLRAAQLPADFPPFVALRQNFGYLPALFEAQGLLPEAIETEAALAQRLISSSTALTRIQKERILLLLAVAHRRAYCVASHAMNLSLLGIPDRQLAAAIEDFRSAGLPEKEVALLDFALRLGYFYQAADLDRLGELGWNEASLMETIYLTGFGNFLCTVAAGLGTAPDFEPPRLPAGNPAETCLESPGGPSSKFAARATAPATAPPTDGEISLASERCIQPLIASRDRLTDAQKDAIQQTVRAGQIDVNGEEDQALQQFALRLSEFTGEFGLADIDRLRGHGFTDAQVLAAILIVAWTHFSDTVEAGFGTNRPRSRNKLEKNLHLSPVELRPIHNSESPGADRTPPDPDLDIVRKVQNGDRDAFEELIQRHGQRVYRTIFAIVGNPDQAHDGTQETFLKAYQNIGRFETRSKFSTWLMSIASNQAVQQLRDRRPVESLDEDDGFRPRLVQAWTDTPEQLYSEAQRREIVAKAIHRLPVKYRTVLVLRDLQQLSTEEAAESLGLGVPALKARLIRGRLMLREALAPHFSSIATPPVSVSRAPEAAQ